MKEFKVVEKLEISKLVSIHYWYIILPKKLKIMQEKVQSFQEVQNYRFYGDEGGNERFITVMPLQNLGR
jgi:hypothetical protein